MQGTEVYTFVFYGTEIQKDFRQKRVFPEKQSFHNTKGYPYQPAVEVPSIAILSLLTLYSSLQTSRTSVCVKLNGHRAGFECHESELVDFILFFYTAKAEINQDQIRSENWKHKKLISFWRNFGHCLKQDTYPWFGNKLYFFVILHWNTATFDKVAQFWVEKLHSVTHSVPRALPSSKWHGRFTCTCKLANKSNRRFIFRNHLYPTSNFVEKFSV